MAFLPAFGAGYIAPALILGMATLTAFGAFQRYG